MNHFLFSFLMITSVSTSGFAQTVIHESKLGDVGSPSLTVLPSKAHSDAKQTGKLSTSTSSQKPTTMGGISRSDHRALPGSLKDATQTMSADMNKLSNSMGKMVDTMQVLNHTARGMSEVSIENLILFTGANTEAQKAKLSEQLNTIVGSEIRLMSAADLKGRVNQ